jgi:hypothetical protein
LQSKEPGLSRTDAARDLRRHGTRRVSRFRFARRVPWWYFVMQSKEQLGDGEM